MIVDTSAVLAVLFGEEDADKYAQAISEAEPCRISAATFVEVGIIVETLAGDAGARQCDLFFRRAGIDIAPVTEEQAYAARQAYSEFGKGRHPAALNFGDCFSYALAKISGEPLLYKGDNFRHTDIYPAV